MKRYLVEFEITVADDIDVAEVVEWVNFNLHVNSSMRQNSLSHCDLDADYPAKIKELK